MVNMERAAGPPPAIRMLSETEVAERHEIAQSTLRSWRTQRKGPRYYKVGRTVRYRIEDLDAFFAGVPVETMDSLRIAKEEA